MIALCQITVTPDKERNIAHARSKIQEAAAKGAKLVLLPVSITISTLFLFLIGPSQLFFNFMFLFYYMITLSNSDYIKTQPICYIQFLFLN